MSSLIENFFRIPHWHQRRGADQSRATPGPSFRCEIFHAFPGSFAFSSRPGVRRRAHHRWNQCHDLAGKDRHHFNGCEIQPDRSRRPRGDSKEWACFTRRLPWKANTAGARPSWSPGRKLRGSGRHVLIRDRQEGHPGRPWRRPRQKHVELSCRTAVEAKENIEILYPRRFVG